MSPDASPPEMSATLQWGSIHPHPTFRACEATFVFTSNEPVNVTYVAIEASLQQWPLVEAQGSLMGDAAPPVQNSSNVIAATSLKPLSDAELHHIALRLVGSTKDGSGKHMRISPDKDGIFQDSAGLHVHLRLTTLPCGTSVRLLAVAEDNSGNIGKHAVEVHLDTPDITAPLFVNGTPQAVALNTAPTQRIAVQLELSEPATVACAVMHCFPGTQVQSDDGFDTCSHTIGIASGSLLQQSVSNVPRSSRMWATAVNTTAVQSAWQTPSTLLLQAELVCFYTFDLLSCSE